MEHLASSIISIVAALQFYGEDVVDSDFAIEMMEMVNADLQNCTPLEKEALEQAAQSEYEAHIVSGAAQEVLDFYRTFVPVFVENQDP